MDSATKTRLEKEHGVQLVLSFTETWWAHAPVGRTGEGAPIGRFHDAPAIVGAKIEEWLEENSEALRKNWDAHRARFLRTLTPEQRTPEEQGWFEKWTKENT